MSKIEVEFEFELGDLVFLRGAQHIQQSRPKRYVIYERMASECHGGCQRLYKVLGWSEPLPEILLTKTEPPYQPEAEEYLAERQRIIELEQQATMRGYRSHREKPKDTGGVGPQ